jgi:hypothetical protein
VAASVAKSAAEPEELSEESFDHVATEAY